MSVYRTWADLPSEDKLKVITGLLAVFVVSLFMLAAVGYYNPIEGGCYYCA